MSLLSLVERKQSLISLAALGIALAALLVSVASIAQQQGIPYQEVVSRIARYGISFQAPPIVVEGFMLCLSPNAPASEAVKVFLRNTANADESVRVVVYITYHDGQQERTVRFAQDVNLGPGGQSEERINFTNPSLIPLDQIRSVQVVLLKVR